jgi:hypothetical protein
MLGHFITFLIDTKSWKPWKLLGSWIDHIQASSFPKNYIKVEYQKQDSGQKIQKLNGPKRTQV